MTDNTSTDAPATTRKPKAGPLRPEPPRKLAAGSPVADATLARRFGKVKTILPGDRFVVEWQDGETSTAHRSALLSRFTSATKAPKR